MPDYGVDRQEPATTLHLTAVVTPDDDWFMARCVEVPVVSQGPTVDKALANLTLKRALERAGFVEVRTRGSHCKLRDLL